MTRTLLIGLGLSLLSLTALHALAQEPKVAEALNKPAAPESRPMTPAPDIELPVFDGGQYRLADAWAEGYVLIVFVRGMW